MILEKLDKISAELVAELASTRAPESPTLEFKRLLPGSGDSEKREFLKDVCAMANALGGDVVYGIDEKDGAAAALAPLTGESADAAMRRLGQLLDACVEPRLRVRFQPVDLPGGQYVLILRVPQSQIGPHRFNHQSQTRFPIRTATHVSDMSYEQIRSAFDRTATLTERARRFRADRLEAIQNGRSGKNLAGGTSAVVHALPLASMGGQDGIDIIEASAQYLQIALSNYGSFSRTLNLDGLFVYQANGTDDIHNYVQLYRSGAVEIYGSGFSMDYGNKTVIPSQDLVTFFHEAIEKALATPSRFGVGGGAYVGISLLDAGGHTLGVGQMFNMRHKAVADRQHLVLPEHWVENIEKFEIDEVAKPLLDMLWQCFGIETCTYYDENGIWCPDRRIR